MTADQAAATIRAAADLAWGPWTIALLFAIGLFLSFRLRFVQVRRFGEALRTLLPSEGAAAAGALSPFQAFMSALAATIGTGNIAGVATAVVSGGPGAVFWIWCYGFFATAIKFTEAVLGIRFRVGNDEKLSAGPMHYLRDGAGLPVLAWIYAFSAGIAALLTTPLTQPNSMAVVLHSQFAVPTWVSGVVIAVLAWLVIIGGIQSIGRAAEKLSPLKVLLYLAGGLWVLLSHAAAIPEVIGLILREAFSLRGAVGGSAGVGMMVAMRYGLARGVYANEAGLGTAAVIYGTARSREPAQQGLNAVMEVFIVSFVTTSISALTILVTGAWRSGLTSTAVVALAFDSALPTVGGWIVAFCACLFGYTTLIGWSYYGEKFLEYIFGPRVVVPYRWLYCGLILLGAVARVETVWAWGDLLNAIQLFPNLYGVLALSGIAASVARGRTGHRMLSIGASVAQPYEVGPARADEVPLLPDIERRACDLFLQSPLTAGLPPLPTPIADLQEARQKGLLWVARLRGGAPVGFAVVEDLEGEPHLEELDVLPEHGRRGLGTALVREVCGWARSTGRGSLTLCTFRDIPWNAPFYERLGFRRLAPEELTPALARRMREEAEAGLAVELRLAMRHGRRGE